MPNSSNHCTCQRIFIMYSYIRIIFYFCMHDGGGDCGRQLGGGAVAAAAWQQQLRQLGGGSLAAAAAVWQQWQQRQ